MRLWREMLPEGISCLLALNVDLFYLLYLYYLLVISAVGLQKTKNCIQSGYSS